MSQKMEVEQNAPSVIAKLMGIDELPPQQPLHRRQKVLSEDYLRKTASIGLLENSSVCVGRLSKKTAEKWDKHLYGSGISKINKQILWSISCEKANPGTARGEFCFSRQRNSHGNRNSMDKKLYRSKGFDNMLEDQNATRDDVKRFFHHPDLSTKWVGDSNAIQLHLHPGQLSTSMSTSDSNDSDIEVCKKPNKMMTQMTVLRSLQKIENGEKDSHVNHLDELLKSELELQDKSSYSSRRIVVLKPSSGKAPNCGRDFLLPTSDVLSQSGSRLYKELGELKPENRETNTRIPEKAGFTTDLEPPRHSFRVTRRVAKKTADEGKQNTISSPRGSSRSRIPADESSVNVSEASMISSQRSFDGKRSVRVSYPFPSRSIFTREAKKQIFERWKTTKNFQEVEVEVACRRCTLGEMFAMHDGGAGPKTLYSKIEKHCSGSPLCPQGENSGYGSPLDIGGKCGSKTEFLSYRPRSKHFDDFYMASGSPNLTTINEASQNGWCGGQQDTIAEKSYKLKNENFNKEDNLEPRDLRTSCEKHHSADLEVSHYLNQSPTVPELSVCNAPYSGSNDNPPFQVTQVNQDELELNRDKKDIHNEVEQSSGITVRNLSSEGLAYQNLLNDAKSEVEVSSEKQLSEIAPCIFLVKDGCTSSDVWDNFTPQRPLCLSPKGEISRRTSDSDLAMKLDEINHPSPDSVLDPPFMEETTVSSECSDSPVADLSGLAMKLQLLDFKSKETNSETSDIAVSSYEDSVEGSLNLSRDNEKMWGALRPEESRDFSYLIDVLDGACLCDRNLDLCFETLHATEWPSLFETLEKKYGKQTSWLKSERRLLFDHINSALREILNSFMVFQISAKPLKRRFNASLRRGEIEEELWMLLLSHEKEVSKDLPEKVVGREMKWFELEEDIGIICKEIEEFLFDELAAELGSNECS